ncbi:formate dehydrogenase subunit delta [Paraburkholderia rhizosphaerae]|uniref:Formate dehydrogenase delta subunit n=1 Tax=Paraburkholderia rhizosphaerae TaxID=480658 RepID=A0A4R8LM47_9BURK|nr:formate dehydrogenase subunit delta [Paraburkholderia rhizosphaerae]TDY46411.1 formate dehydrogenase delta subunit [Paraburkholderia rhizosphaerae]
MDENNLIDMANRIGDFFESMPDHEEALAGVADHIRRFWEPRMRRQFIIAIDEGRADALTAFTREAVTRYREKLMPAAPAAV